MEELIQCVKLFQDLFPVTMLGIHCNCCYCHGLHDFPGTDLLEERLWYFVLLFRIVQISSARVRQVHDSPNCYTYIALSLSGFNP